jgi:nucleoside-diphosphate-sugar epimerase
MKILITGGTGFIGAYLAEHCATHGHSVTICDNNLRGRRDEYIDFLLKTKQIKLMVLDLTKREEVATLEKDFELVFHLAAINGTENFYKIPYSVMNVAIKSTMLLMEHFRDTKCKFVFSSSSEVYAGTIHKSGSPIPTPETVGCTILDIKNERFSYGGSKLACEILINSFSKQHGLDYLIIRYHNIYGPRMGTKHVIPQLIYRAKNTLKDDPFLIYGPTQTRAFCHINDACDATLLLALSDKKNDIYHIGNDMEEIEIKKLASLVLKNYKIDPKLDFRAAPLGSVFRRCPDISKLKKDVDYRPRVCLEEGLLETITWYDKWYGKSQDLNDIL